MRIITTEECDICHHETLHREYWCEDFITVEDYGYCDKCGYAYNMAYSSYLHYFWDIKKGYKDSVGKYHKKNWKRHERIRRKYGNKSIIKNIKIESQKYLCWWHL